MNIRNLIIASFAVIGYTAAILIKLKEIGNQLWNDINILTLFLALVFIIYTSLPNFIPNKDKSHIGESN